jgi:catechol 2,3-dioxygenase-like lactoylglutathione lyase family enzyme
MYNHAMSRSGSPIWDVKPAIRLDRRDPYLLLQHVTVLVRDQDRSLRFYVDCLGFSTVLDHRFPDGGRFIAVAPPDGTARLALVIPPPDSAEYPFIGKGRQITFLTEDVEGKYRE